MTRYTLQHRGTGNVWPLPWTHPEGFASATEAVLWAAENSVPASYWPLPLTPVPPKPESDQ